VYDPIASEYAAEFRDELSRKPFDRALLASVADRCHGGVVADLGCGPGHVGAACGASVGLDLSFEMCRLVPFPAVRGDLRAVPLASGSLAGAVAFYCYLHLDSLDAAFAEVHRCLRSGGVFVLATHEGDEPTRHRDEWYGKRVDITARFWPKPSVDAALARAGFTIESSLVRDPYEGELTRRLYVTATA
jgi:SAM-dependent methyltransferase